MNVLVTGATGFLGTALAHRLVEQGHRVSALSRTAGEASPRGLPAAVTTTRWDPLREPAPAADFADIDTVVHLAGAPVNGRWTQRKRDAIRDSRIVGTGNLILGLAAADPRPRQLVSASAIGYYGDRGDELLTEGSAAGTDFLATVCMGWEGEASAAADLGVTVTQVRFGIILGRGGGALAPLVRTHRLGLGGPLGSGHQWWSWIHIDDAVAGLEQLITNGHEGPHNLTSPQPVSQREFSRALGHALRRPALLPAPAIVLRAALGGFATELLSSRRVVPERLQQIGFEHRFGTLEGALRDLVG